MRRIRPIFLFLTLCVFTKSFSQEKNEIRIDLRVFQEDAIFKYFRKHPKNEYVYNQGVGLSIVYTRRLNKRLSTGLETGGWYFFNDAKNIDPLNYAEYR